jgi:hypothetical protein
MGTATEIPCSDPRFKATVERLPTGGQRLKISVRVPETSVFTVSKIRYIEAS